MFLFILIFFSLLLLYNYRLYLFIAFFRSLSFFAIFHDLLKFFYICGGKYMAIGHNGVYARQEEYIIIICMILLEYKLHASVSVCFITWKIFPVRFVLVCAICLRCSLLLDVCLSIWCFPLRFNDYNSPLQYVLSIAASPIFSNYVISMKVCSAHTMHLHVFPVALNQVESSGNAILSLFSRFTRTIWINNFRTN